MYEKILIADDKEDMVSFIKDALENEGYRIFTAYDGESAIKYLLIRLDIDFF
jgi:DNA-binding response OmpR family regulator